MENQFKLLLGYFLVLTMFIFFSCTKAETTEETPSPILPEHETKSETDSTAVVCVDFNHVIGTDIPTTELRNGREISVEEFRRLTEGKYSAQDGYYCQWRGDTLQYLQTGENYYSLRGLHDFIDFFGIWHTQFEDSIMHFYNDLCMLDYRYNYTYEDKIRVLTIPNFKFGVSERMSCEVVYIDDKFIIVETAPFQAIMSSEMSHLTAAQAEFVQLIFMAVDPPEYFIGFTDWEVNNCEYPDD